MVFRIAVIQRPTLKEQESGAEERILIGSQELVAETQQAAVLAMGVKNAKELSKEGVPLTRLSVVVQTVSE